MELTLDRPVLKCLHCGNDIRETGIFYENSREYCCNGCCEADKLLNSIENDTSLNTGNYLDDRNFYQNYLDSSGSLKMNFYIEGMKCVNCVSSIEKIPLSVESINSVYVNMGKNIATVTFNDPSFSEFPSEVEKLGFKAHPVRNDKEIDLLRNTEKKNDLVRLGLAAVCAGNIMLLSVAIYSGAEGLFKNKFNLINLLLSIPVVTYCSYPFYRSAISSVLNKKASVDIPIVLVILLCFLWSSYNILTGLENIYLDSISVFIFLILLSRFLLGTVRDKYALDIKNILNYNFNSRILKWNNTENLYTEHPSDDLKAGDRIKLIKNQQLPADGKLTGNQAYFNVSFLTGESRPKSFLSNEIVHAGSILNSESAEIEIQAVGDETQIGRFFKKVEAIYNEKTLFSSFSEKYSSVFTFAVITISILSLIVFLLYMTPLSAMERVMAFILISCPCAFIFATPLAYRKALINGISKGYVIRNLDIFDKFRDIKTFFFDKTGTLTKGTYKVLKWDTAKLSSDELDAIYSLENSSNHPISGAILNYLGNSNIKLKPVKNFKNIFTRGISGEVGSSRYEITGSASQKNNYNRELIISTINIYKDSELISTVYLGDEIKENITGLFDFLGNEGFGIKILSGDNSQNVDRIAELLSVPAENVYSGLSPDEKISIIKASPGSVMVGDGLNDSGAFASADISIAVKGSVEKNFELSDLFFISDSIEKIKELIVNVRSTNNTLRRNIVISVIYNISAGYFALSGFITPLLAALLMPLSSLILLASTHFANSHGKKGGNY